MKTMEITQRRSLEYFWGRLPVVLRAVVAGSVVLIAGGILTTPLIYANLKLWPSVPWSVLGLAIYMGLFWRYLGGRWGPRWTSDARRQSLRARRLSRRVWWWAMLAGYLAMVSNFALHRVVARLTPLRFDVPDVLQQFPPVTLVAILLMVSAIAGIVEEAAFRGYMQGPIEKRHGVVMGIAVASVVFGAAHLTDWQPSMTIARMFFIVLASAVYGILAHLVNSIRPGIVLHATGDAIGIGLIWWFSTHPSSAARDPGLAAALAEPTFLINLGVAVAFGIAAVWAFRRLAFVAGSERPTVS